MEDIVCTGCSLLCDDVSAEVEGKSVNSLGLCKLGHTHLEALIKNKNDSPENNLEKAANILANAKNLLLYGWTHVSNEAIEKGLDLATTLQGQFASSVDMDAMKAMSHNIHSEGLGIDLEYVRNNGEFIIYWGADPSESLHRHPSRFAVLPRGEKIPEGIESRSIGVVDVRQTETMKMANHRLIIPPGSDAELLEIIKLELEGKSSIKETVLGIPGSELVGLVSRFQKSDCTVIFYGTGVVNSGNMDATLSGIASLVDILRSAGKEAYALPMFVQTNTMGVIKATQKGKSDSSSLQKLVAGEFDTVLVVGEDVLANLPGPAAKALAKTQIVYVGPPGGLTDKKALVSIHTTDSMIAGSGSMTRVDMNDIKFKKWTVSKDDETISNVLIKLEKHVNKKT